MRIFVSCNCAVERSACGAGFLLAEQQCSKAAKANVMLFGHFGLQWLLYSAGFLLAEQQCSKAAKANVMLFGHFGLQWL
ncbi:hypothetical protein CLV59_11412 [Chitinophaga dinghuensis]|uniref:Uncharacterized protein n=1 Tax=Chitinophaga dinghuensis TaxID=1539050 RepID=A0A327VJ14_9BACT|nr:hypothetical protein CLV59_11412 [Chitinophaga dinghuensis]